MASNTCMGVYQFKNSNIPKDLFRNVIKPLVESYAGLHFVDALDEYEANEIKMYHIAEMIRSSRLVIADITNKNANVFFELGVAYESKIPVVIICLKKEFEKSESDGGWGGRPPFDIQGREILPYEDEKDLKVKLTKFIHSIIYKSKMAVLTWVPNDGRKLTNHAPDRLEISPDNEVWLTKPINFDFTISYKASLDKVGQDLKKGCDLRLLLSNAPFNSDNPSSNYPRIAVIYPWESVELNYDKRECHIDYLNGQGSVVRMVQESVSEIQDALEFEAFCSFVFPNMVFEASKFLDERQRLIVCKDRFLEKGFHVNRPVYVGFSTTNQTKAVISNIVIKEIQDVR